MLPASHLISHNVPGHGLSNVGCPRALTLSPCSSCNNHIRFPKGKVTPLGTSFICNANSSSGQRRNPDFSKQNRNGFSRNKNRHNEDRDSPDSFDDPETFSSKNGPPFLSGSTSPKFQATATPGPREREIVEIFRKVQARLRERAALKEEKKVEDSQAHNKQNETVDSLLKLLRKHSIQHGKSTNGLSRSNTNNSNHNRDFILDQHEQNNTYIEDRIQKDSKSNEVQSIRPVSNFQRRSPVPQLKYKPILSRKETIHGPRPKPEPEHEPETKLEAESEPEIESVVFRGFDDSSDDEISDVEVVDDIDDDSEEGNVTGNGDLSGMKLPELRAVAKSRGMKGVSRLKKRELLELLSS